MNDPPTHADESFQEICHVADEAVRLIQQRWRFALAQRRPAARQPGATLAARRVLASSEGGTVTAAVSSRSRRLVREDEQPENSEAVVAAAKQLCLAEAKARAARQIQRRWRQYREAVEELRSLRSTVSTHGSVEELNALCDYLQDDSVWSQDDDDDDDNAPDTAAESGETVSHPRTSPPLTQHHGADAVQRSTLPAASPSPPPPDGEARVSVSSLLSSIFAVVPSVALHHHHHHIDAEEHPPPAGVRSSSSVSHDRTDFDAVDSLRQLAAQIIQGWYRRNLRRRNRLQAVPESAVNALRVLQNRFRMVRLRRIMRERDAHQLVSRLQSLWRRRRELKQHFAALRRGREDAAARDIQRAYLRHRQRQNGFAVSTPPEQRLGGVPALATSSMARGEGGGETSMPVCIVCLGEEVQIAMLPCGHAQVCAGCGSRCDRCPTCRKLIALQIRIYL